MLADLEPLAELLPAIRRDQLHLEAAPAECWTPAQAAVLAMCREDLHALEETIRLSCCDRHYDVACELFRLISRRQAGLYLAIALARPHRLN